MELSICIPTTGRPTLQQLVSTLHSSAKKADVSYEVIIGDGSQAVQVERAIVLPNPQKTASAGRNICAQQASGESLAFIDDDCFVDSTYLKQVAAAIHHHAHFTAFAGVTRRLRGDSSMDQAWLEAGFDRYFTLPERFPYLRWSPTSNLIVRKSTFLAVKGFPHLEVPVGGEDVDFGMALCSAGLGPIFSCPNIVVYHHSSSAPLEALCTKARYYGVSEQILAQKYPQYRSTNSPGENDSKSSLVSQLRGAFEEGRASYPAPRRMSLSAMADALNNIDGRINMMMIKPGGIKYKREIQQKMIAEGFLPLQEITKVLSIPEAQALYHAVFQQLLEESEGTSYVANHLNYLTSNTACIMVTYNRGFVSQQRVSLFRGTHFRGEQCYPGSIRHDYPGSGVFNSFHCSLTMEETEAQMSLFFPTLTVGCK